MQENIGVQVFQELNHSSALDSQIVLAQADWDRIKKVVVPFHL